MNIYLDFFKSLGVSRIAAMVAVAVSLIGFFIYLMVKLTQPQMAVLFTDLPFEDSLSVVKKLEAMNLPHEIRQEGSMILVPKDKVLRLRMELAENGIPTGGSVGYELFDKTDSLGATSFVQNINHLRAIEGELARTIRSLDNVQLARVHLVLPQKKLFSRKNTAPSASIVVKIRGSLGSGQIKAIQHLVASAVDELQPDRVSIVDERGKLLATGNGESGGATATGADERNRAFENRLTEQIEEIVSSVVGPGHVRVTVNAELDYSRITKQSEIYDPDGQVIRSNQISQEKSSSNLPSSDGSVSVGNELPAAGEENGSSGSQSEDVNKTEETINYEISRTTQTETIEAGRIQRVSVAVLVDGKYSKDATGKFQYQPRNSTELEQITQLVRSSIGFDQERGDQIHVSNLQFVQNEASIDNSPEQASLLSFSKNDYFYLAELIITLIVSLLVLMFVVRPLVRRIITPEDSTNDAQLLSTDSITQKGVPQLASSSSEFPALENNSTPVELPQSTAVLALQQAKISGEVQQATLKEIGQLIHNNPQEATSVVQTWINEATATASR